MNQHLQKILDLIEQSEHLSAAEKTDLLKAAKDAEKELEITTFKLDRTEKVKRTTAILLEETIEELEQKRKAVEAQNRELEIESSLERVRTVAMSMNKTVDMLLVCRVISEQLELLKVKDIRNVQTAIIYESKGTYFNYEYYRLHDKTFITEVDFKLHPAQSELVYQMKKGPQAFFTKSFSGEDLQKWLAYQKTTNQFVDSYLETATSINWYFYSMGEVALGVSAYTPLNEEQVVLFNRFRNVFEMAYRRFLDIEKAIAQAKEAQIETSLERVRAQAMAMRTPEDLAGICEVLYAELHTLGFAEMRNAMINIYDDAKETFVNYDYSDELGKSINHLAYDIHPVIKKQIGQLRSAGDAFSESHFKDKDLEDMKAFRKTIGEKDDPRIDKADALYYYFYSIGTGAIGISTFNAVDGEKLDVLKRFRNVFNLSYQRYTDIALAEAQAREAQIELSLERVRARAMAMQHSDELAELVSTVFKELTQLDFLLTSCIIWVDNPELITDALWMASSALNKPAQPYFIKPFNHSFFKSIIHAWKAKDTKWIYAMSGSEKSSFQEGFFSEIPDLPDAFKKALSIPEQVVFSASFSNFGALEIVGTEPITDEKFEILHRFGKVFDSSYTRFNDLKKAEAQTREAQIELALERVRARTMAMQKSEELADTAYVLFQQFKELGETPHQITIAIIKEAEGFVEFHITSGDGSGTQINQTYNFDINEPALIQKLVEGWKENKRSSVIELAGKNLTDWVAHRSEVSGIIDNTDYSNARRYVGAGFFTKGLISISTIDPLATESILLLERFAQVFDQTYTRFLDLQKAEAQAREAQIEAAMERVRSRTMAMHNSQDVGDTVATLFEEFVKLGIETFRCGIGIIHEERKMEIWTAKRDRNGKVHFFNGYMDMTTHPMLQGAYYSWTKKQESYVYELKDSDLKEYFTSVNNNPNYPLKYDIPSLPSRLIFSVFYFAEGFLFAFTLEELPAEAKKIFKRFSGVFSQTYTRFQDLQKAEAQAKEAQIEAALERVRSRTMAMQRSDELLDVASVLFQQVKALGVPQWNCGFNIWNIGDKEFTYYPGSPDGIISPSPCKIPLTEHPVFKRFDESRKRGVELLVYEKEGEEQADHYRYMLSLPGLGELLRSMLDGGFQLPTFQIDHVANFAYGNLIFITYEHFPEMHEVFKRFAKVFEQTYTRFLDLQKAEAQAREAQIELALERVRARTMAMQKSEELPETSKVLYQQMKNLEEPAEQLSIGIVREAEKIVEISATLHGDALQKIYWHSMDEPYVMNKIFNAWKSQQKTLVVEIAGEELNAYNKYRNELTGDEKFPTNLTNENRRIVYVAFFSRGMLALSTNEPRPAASLKLLQRFAAVFDQTYTRFLDLQKAEAQAREAKIEASLERVRSKAMAMHSSEDLALTVSLFFVELNALNVTPHRCGVSLVDQESRIADFTATAATEEGDTKEMTGKLKLTGHHVLDAAYDHWINQIEYHPVLHGDEIKKYYQFMNPQVEFPDFSKDTVQFGHYFSFKEGFVFAWTEKELKEEELLIFRKFTSVLSLTYRRYMDLTEAEAQAREAQIEASLERVRSKAMAMQKSDDLANAVATVFEELDKLDLGMLRCGIGILDKEKRSADVWTTTKSENDTVVQVSGGESMDIHPLLQGAFEAWTNQVDHSYILKGDDLNNYYRALIDENFRLPYSQSLVAGTEGTTQYYYNAVFASGGLFAFRDTDFSTEAKTVMKRFADVFDFTYTRFNDLQKAEAQAKEAQIEAALERVRSRTLAMQKSDELAETAAELFRQLISLGIEPNRLYIGIVKEETGDMEMWATDEDGTHIGKKFMFNKDENDSVKKLFDGWKAKEKSVIVDMQGKELEDYFHYLNHVMHIPFKGGLTQKRRVQSVAYFSKGFIGMASPDGQGDETIQLLERFAAVFNLTFTRFNDLKIAEAHAEQAEQDLVAIKEAKQNAEAALTELQATQKQLIQSEKMASLGELTAGIAHEIQNPLNFVNNFSEVSKELLDEMREAIEKGDTEEAKEIMNDVIQNLEKINHHGKRADGIVKGMLQHSRSSTATKEPTDINKLADEYLRLAYHGLRAKDKSFNAAMKTDYDESIGNINIIPQDMGRVILNLITNAFYVVAEKKKSRITDYEPTVSVSTKKSGDKVLIIVKDNGNGIPQKVLDKIFQPFFTTKPTGQGTGLGLSLSYDIVKAHGGELKVETKEGEGSEFIIQLPF